MRCDSGADWTGLARTGLARTGLDWTRLDWLDWTTSASLATQSPLSHTRARADCATVSPSSPEGIRSPGSPRTCALAQPEALVFILCWPSVHRTHKRTWLPSLGLGHPSTTVPRPPPFATAAKSGRGLRVAPPSRLHTTCVGRNPASSIILPSSSKPLVRPTIQTSTGSKSPSRPPSRQVADRIRSTCIYGLCHSKRHSTQKGAARREKESRKKTFQKIFC